MHAFRMAGCFFCILAVIASWHYTLVGLILIMILAHIPLWLKRSIPVWREFAREEAGRLNKKWDTEGLRRTREENAWAK